MTTENTDKPACPICEGTGVVDSVRPACGPPRWLDEPGEPMKPQDPRQWFPMDTAPRDGTVIVLRWGQDGESPGWWLKRKVFANGGRCYSWAFIDGGTDGRPFVNHAVDTEYGPTHWTPYTGPGYTIRSGDMCRHGKWASEPCEQCDGIRVLTTPPAAAPAPAVEREAVACHRVVKPGLPTSLGIGKWCDGDAPADEAANWEAHGYVIERAYKPTPPAEAREPVGDAEWVAAREDLRLYGCAFMRDGKRIDPLEAKWLIPTGIIARINALADTLATDRNWTGSVVDELRALAQPQATTRDAEDADTKRLGWLEAQPDEFANIDRITSVGGKFNRFATLREAIDAAMQSPTGEPA